MLSIDQDHRIAQRTAKWINRHEIHEFGRREVFSALQTTQLQKASQLDEPLKILESHGYIRPVQCEKGRPGRPAQRYATNPDLFEMETVQKHPAKPA